MPAAQKGPRETNAFDNPVLQEEEDADLESQLSPRGTGQTFEDETATATPMTFPPAAGSKEGMLSSAEQSLDGMEDAVMRFKHLDADGSGFLDREQVKVMLQMMGRPDDDDSVDDMLTQLWRDGGEQSTVGDVSLNDFVAWWRNNVPKHGKQARRSRGMAKALSSAGGQVKKSSKAIGEATGLEEKQKEKARSVAPESMFVMDQTGNTEAREKHESAVSIQEQFESDFKHLEDIMLSSLGTGWIELWEEAMAAHWEQQEKDEVLEQFDEAWTGECIDAAATGIMLTQGSVHALHRGFLRSQIPDPEATTGRFKMRFKKEKQLTPAAARSKAKEFAAEQLADGARELDKLMDAELLPLEAAAEAVCQAVRLEVEQREAKVKSLVEKRDRMGADTPRKVQVSGLRGAAAEANGIYVADGLKAFWNRPLYVQMPEHHDISNLHYLYFDMAYTTQDERGTAWSDATWIIGPTLNSDRCTAYFDEPAGTNILYPMPSSRLEDSTSSWMVFDVIRHKWATAPGGHCPAFAIIPLLDGEETMAKYIEAATTDQQDIIAQVKTKLEGSGSADTDESFKEMVQRNFGLLSEDDRCITRKDFLTWRNQFYLDELEGVKQRLRSKILDRSSGVKFPSSNDQSENQDFVENMLDEFVIAFDMKQQTRRVAKRKFLATVNKPVLSRAFFSWKFACRSKNETSNNQMSSSGMFTEPDLPWNVRHPNSNFNHTWESVQFVLLMYVSYAVVWRLSFNVPAEGFYFHFEVLIDVFFTIDIILNAHTAYYNDSGDLMGIKMSGRKAGKADFKKLYWHYATGWMVVDVMSVLPVELILRVVNPSGEQTGEQLKILKALRLMRMLKLLRIARGMQIYKNHEDRLGPAVGGFVTIGVVFWCLHTICCLWYLAGAQEPTPRGDGPLLGLHDQVGWVEQQFSGTERHCWCYNTPGLEADMYFDTFDRVCMNITDLTQAVKEPCVDSDHAIPSPVEYYWKSMFKSMTRPYSETSPVSEILVAIGAAILMGYLWGAIAGAWSTIFAANQMASQAYKMKMREVREFCKLKNLDWGARAKLVAHYEHLYPEQVIVNEKAILDELPPRMRDDLIRDLYGQVIASVPLFFGLDRSVLTELCLALVSMPALKGQSVVRQGQMGGELYVINTGICRVTQKTLGSDNTERVRQWLTEVYNSFSLSAEPLKLYEPNEKGIMEDLLKQIKKLKQRKIAEFERTERDRALKQQASTDTMMVSSDKMQSLEEKHKEKSTRITYKDVLDDETIERVLHTHNAELERLLYSARSQGLVQFAGELTLKAPEKKKKKTKKADEYSFFFGNGDDDDEEEEDDAIQSADTSGPVITLSKTKTQVEGKSSSYMMCQALRDGVVLCEVANFFVQPKQRIIVWKPSIVDKTMASSVALTADLVDGTLEAAAAGAAMGEVMAREAAERAEAVAREAAAKSAEMAEKAAIQAAEQAAKKGGAAGAAAVEQLKAAKQAAAKAAADAQALAEQAKAHALEATGDMTHHVSTGVSGGMSDGMSMVDGLADVSAADVAGAATDGIYDALGGGPKQNLKNFRQLCLNPESGFDIPAEEVLLEDDLLDFNKGSDAEQAEKQQRVVQSVLSLAYSMLSKDGYYGPQLDEANLGTLSSGEFFSELALLPLKGGWRHRRTVTAVTNSLLYSLSKQSVDLIAQRFPTLQHNLTDHAEDFEKISAMRKVQSSVADQMRDSKARQANAGGVEHASTDSSPISMIQEHLQQQDSKMGELDLKLSQQDHEIKAVQRQLKQLISLLTNK